MTAALRPFIQLTELPERILLYRALRRGKPTREKSSQSTSAPEELEALLSLCGTEAAQRGDRSPVPAGAFRPLPTPLRAGAPLGAAPRRQGAPQPPAARFCDGVFKCPLSITAHFLRRRRGSPHNGGGRRAPPPGPAEPRAAGPQLAPLFGRPPGRQPAIIRTRAHARHTAARHRLSAVTGRTKPAESRGPRRAAPASRRGATGTRPPRRRNFGDGGPRPQPPPLARTACPGPAPRRERPDRGAKGGRAGGGRGHCPPAGTGRGVPAASPRPAAAAAVPRPAAPRRPPAPTCRGTSPCRCRTRS